MRQKESPQRLFEGVVCMARGAAIPFRSHLGLVHNCLRHHVIVEGDFFFNGIERWNLGWATPNCAGGFLVSLLSFAWIGHGRWKWRAPALAIEAAGYFLLVKTYSRGALVALLIAAALFILILGLKQFVREKQTWLVRGALLGACIAGTGFFSRITPDFVVADGAVVHRLELWRAALAMMASAPFSGWGRGESGRIYMNWFQDLDRSEGYTTMVNSFLNVGVEYGLIAFGLILFGFTWLLASAWRGGSIDSPIAAPGTSHRVIAAAAAAWGAWGTVNIFTTLWIEPRLWWVPTGAAVILAWNGRRHARATFLRITTVSAVAVMIATIGLGSAGEYIARNRNIRVRLGPDGAVVANRTVDEAVSARMIWYAWPDRAVTGPTPGKELRRWLEEQTAPIELRAQRTAIDPAKYPIPAEGIMLFGRQAERWTTGSLPLCRQLWLIHPLSRPPLFQSSSGDRDRPKIVVVLPDVDEAGNGSKWREWTAHAGARAIKSRSSGIDIRSAWPAAARLSAIAQP